MSSAARSTTQTAVLAAAVLLGELLLPPVAGAQNLVANGEFDVDVDGWTVISPSISDLDWHTADATGCGDDSGSALATNFSIVASGSSMFEYCVPDVAPGQLLSFGGRLRFPTGQVQTGYSYILLSWMEQDDCQGNGLGGEVSDLIVQSATAGTWVRTRNDGVVAPAGTQSVALRLYLLKDSATGSLDLRADSVYLVPAPGYLFADGFEIASGCRWTSEVP